MIETSLINKSRQAAANPLLLQTAKELIEAEKSWEKCATLGIDTEFLRERTYRAALGLVQVSDGETAWLVDTIKLDAAEPLKALFKNSEILKVFHSASEDLEVLWNSFAATPAPMIDTQIACAMLGQPLQMSYHNMVKWMMEVEVDKEQTRSNWIRRPLTPAQLHYAATDVVFLPAVAEKLQNKLESKGRWSWLQEDVAVMSQNSRQKTKYDEAYLRLASARYLDTQSLRALKALAAWREQTADEQNLARGFVIPDQALQQLASKQPSTAREMTEIEGLHPKVVQRHREALLGIIESSRTADEPVKQISPLDPAQNKLVKKMRQLVTQKAEELDLDPALLASKKLLESLVRAHESHEPVPERLTGWRHDVITSKLLDLAARETKS